MTLTEKFEQNIDQVNSDFQAIKSKLIECGVEVPDGTKTAELAEKVGEVYNSGRKAENDEFWDAFTYNGARTKYNRAFNNWGSEYIRPNRKIIPTNVSTGIQTFANNPNLKKIEAAYFDFSQKPFGTNDDGSWYNTFDNCPNLEEIEDIGLVPTFRYYGTFTRCPKLHTIAKMRVNEDTGYINPFSSGIVNLTIEGIIGQNGFDTRSCKNLSKASITSIINALSTTTSGLTVTLSKTAVDNAFEGGSGGGEFHDLIDSKENWTISLI